MHVSEFIKIRFHWEQLADTFTSFCISICIFIHSSSLFISVRLCWTGKTWNLSTVSRPFCLRVHSNCLHLHTSPAGFGSWSCWNDDKIFREHSVDVHDNRRISPWYELQRVSAAHDPTMEWFRILPCQVLWQQFRRCCAALKCSATLHCYCARQSTRSVSFLFPILHWFNDCCSAYQQWCSFGFRSTVDWAAVFTGCECWKLYGLNWIIWTCMQSYTGCPYIIAFSTNCTLMCTITPSWTVSNLSQWAGQHCSCTDTASRTTLRQHHKLHYTSTTYKVQRTSFSYAGPTAWNSLPHELRAAPTLNSFKCRLKTHLFNTAFNC